MAGAMDMFRNMMGNKNPVQTVGLANQSNQQQQTVNPALQAGGLNNPNNAVIPNAAPGQLNANTQLDKNIPENQQKQAEQGLDFNKIWEQPDGKQVDPGKFSRPKYDSNKLREGVGKMSFTQGLDQAQVAKALGGDVQSFMDILEAVQRNTFMTSFQASETYNGQLLDNYDKTVDARIPREIGRQETQNLVRNSFKGLDNPAVAPMLQDITAKFQQAYPDASPQQIAEAAKNYLLEAAKLITGQSESGENKQAGNGTQRAQRNSGAITDFSNFDATPQQTMQ